MDDIRPILTSPAERRRHIRDAAVASLTNVFPIETNNFDLSAKNVRVHEKDYTPLDYKNAMLRANTLAEPVRADLELKDKSGRVVGQLPDFTLLRLPHLTDHDAFVISGNPVSVANQLRLRPGVYTRKRRDNTVESDFKVTHGTPFRLRMDPNEGVFTMEYGSTRVPLYAALQALGVSDNKIRSYWNKDLLKANQTAVDNTDRQVAKLYRAAVPSYLKQDGENQKQAIKDAFGRVVLDPKVTAKTLGTAHASITPETLLDATQRILKVYQDDVEYDERDSLAYKHLKSVEDFVGERINLDARALRRKITDRLNRSGRKPDLVRAMPPSPFTKGLANFLSTSALAENPTQINPLEMLDHAVRVTSLGEGGIGNERAVPLETRRLHPTHLGILDPIRTPESARSGIDLRMTVNAARDREGNIYVPIENRAGKIEYKSVYDLEDVPVAFPDQAWGAKRIDAMHQGRIQSMQPKKVAFRIPSMHGLYSPVSNLIPFLDSTDGMRASMGAKFLTQALPLRDGEPPLVQVASDKAGESMEEIVGSMMSVKSPISGIVTTASDGQISVRPKVAKHGSADSEKTAERETRKTTYFSDMPLASKTYLDETPRVQVGDEVKKGQVLAEGSYSRGGVMSLGKNLQVAYMPFRSLNTNDAVVISESAAKKLTSMHMIRPGLDLDEDTTADRGRHQAHFGNKYSRKTYTHLDKDGLIKPGTRVNKGDILVAAVRKTTLSPEAAMLGKLHKSLVKPFRDASVTWDVDRPGEVVDVAKTGNKVRLTVKYEDPMEVGSKLCFALDGEILTADGWKPCAEITLDDQCYTLRTDGVIELQEPTELHRYPKAGKIYEVKAQQVELRVNPEHRLYVAGRDNRKYKLRPACEIIGKRVRHKKDGVWNAETPPFVLLPSATILSSGKGSTKSKRASQRHGEIPCLAFLRFMGIYLANGSTSRITRKDRNGSVEYRVDIHSTRGVRHSISGDQRTWVEKTIKDCGFHFISRPDRVSINSKQLGEYLHPFGHAVDKKVPDEVFDFGKDAACALLEGLLGCDGSRGNSKTKHYHTVSSRLANDVQRLSLHAGWAANIVPPYCDGNPKHNDYYLVSIITDRLEPIIYAGRGRYKAQSERITDSDEPLIGITVPNHTLYVRFNGKPVWTGNSNRYGNKGVVASILPDAQMPHNENREPMDLVWSSSSIVSRVNPAQVLEVAVGKVAQKTGKPILIDNFAPRDNVQYVKDLLKKNDVSDTETMYDPETRKRIPGVLTGPSYILKLMKTIDTQFSARGIEGYDIEEQPSAHGKEGSKGFGRMEVNALLGHNARNILKDAVSLKSQKNDEFWRAYQLGLPPPALKTPFAYDKFGAMLRGAGIRMDKSGNQIGVTPLTDVDILRESAGEIKSGKFVRARDLRPEQGGLFDPVITGGPQGKKWSHVPLAEPVLNPVFERPARTFLGMTGPQLADLHRKKGGAEIKRQLNKIDLDAREKELKTKIDHVSVSRRDDLVKQLKYIRALRKADQKPGDAYVISHLPVIPPAYRPIVPGKGDLLLASGSNYLYQDAILASDLLRKSKDAPAGIQAEARDNLYKATSALFGLQDSTNPRNASRNVQGFLARIAGTVPKAGYFHSRVIRKQQDLSGRGAVIPDPSLGMDEVGLPEDMGWKMYSPFLVRSLVTRGYGAVEAKNLVEEKSPVARSILMQEAKTRPVLINRAPTLHRYNVLAAYPRFIPGQAVRVPEMFAPLQNMDFDGDTVQVHVPVSAQGIAEAKKMTLSNNILGDRSKDTLLVKPDQEAVLGLYLATAKPEGQKRKFKSLSEARAAYNRSEITLQTPIEIG